MAWPSTLTSYSNPIPTDRLNSPSHSSVETAQNTGLTELQTYIGLTSGVNASAIGTLIGTIANPNSNGGGHVQTATTGGTGQTTLTKGNILVASNSSTLTKLAVGSDTQVLQANSSAATGISWANSPGGKVYVDNTTYTPSATGEYSVMSTSVLGSTLGTSNVIKTTTYVSNWVADTSATSVIATYFYGEQRVSSIALQAMGAGLVRGTFTHTMIASSASLQKHMLDVDFMSTETASASIISGPISFRPANTTQNPSVAAIVRGQVFSTSSINSSATQNYSLTLQITPGNGTHMSVIGTVVEKILP